MKQKQQGLSLIELLVAIAVFSVIMLVVSGIVIQGLQIRRDSQLDARAQAYANAVLEQYKNHWSSPARYAAYDPALPCVTGVENWCDPKLPDPPAAFDTIAQLDIQTECVYLDGTAPTASCTDAPPLRRLSVTLIDTEGETRASLLTEIGVPRP